MNVTAVIMQKYWGMRHLIPKGVWLVLLSYCLIVFGSPMPPKITWLEIVMGGGLLIGGILLAGQVIRVARQQKTAKWILILTASLFIIPLFVGLLRGNVLSDMVRDIIPLAFLLVIPILLTYSASSANQAALRTLMATVIVLVGICTAVTFVFGVINSFGSPDRMSSMMRGGLGQLEVLQVSQAQQAQQTSQVEQTSQAEFHENLSKYFLKLYDPSMLFAAIYLSAWGIVLMVRSWREWLLGMSLASGGAFIAYAFMATGLRSYTGLIVLAILIICLPQLRTRGLYLRFMPICIVALALFWPQIESVLQLLWIKQQIVGSNGKVGEWSAVLTTIATLPQAILFGIGWGGTFENPILSMPTRFTHSGLSYYLLKSGVIGLSMLLATIGLLLGYFERTHDSVRLDMPRLILLVSSLPPLLIGVLFEPTFKMLSYGVILALLILTLPVRMKLIDDKVG